jgi:putative membrane protein insertion efficiency factor
MKRVLLYLIGWYKRWLSPLQRVPHCRFLPTCSEYAAEAIEIHGPLRGLVMATGRLLRCHPLCRGGHDPVKLPEGTTR